MRLIDADPFGVIFLQGKSEEFIEGVNFILDKIYEAPTIEERPHGEWEHWGSPFSDDSIANSIVCSLCKARYVEIENEVFNYCPNCGASMISSNSEIEKSKSEIEKSKSEIENSNLPERFTATDCSCLNCKNRHSVHCEPQNKKIYGYCGNWERR